MKIYIPFILDKVAIYAYYKSSILYGKDILIIYYV